MRWKVVLGAGVVALTLVGCGSSGSSSTSGPPTTVHITEVAKDVPSASARMICSKEAKDGIAGSLGADTVQALHPTWSKVDHVYACDYLYAHGAKMTLSVKELSSSDETTQYFDALGQRLGRGQSLQGLGQGGYVTLNGSAVVRKDYKVLLVDTSHLPAQFGSPPDTRTNVATNVAVTIMGCWSGA